MRRAIGWICALAAGCGGGGGSDSDGGTNSPRDSGVATSPFEGRWTGTTDEGGPVVFEISSEGKLVSFEIELEISVGTGRCTGSFRATPNSALANGRFDLMTGLQNAAGSVQGSIDATLTGSNATGAYDIDSFAFICGGNFSIGSGGPSGTFTATNQGGMIRPGDGGVAGDGGPVNSGTGVWSAISETGAPSARSNASAVWTGSELIVWGGYDGENSSTGGRYDPMNDRWTPMATNGAPSARSSAAAVWTGSEMIIWGAGSMQTSSGARYDPQNDRWTPMSTAGAPSQRFVSVAVWTGSEMIVWGGFDGDPLNTGARYDPANDRWTAMSNNGAPSGRNGHALIWTGSEMIVYGGNAGMQRPSDAARYNPQTDTWTPLTMTGAPPPRSGIEDAVIWSGSELIVWGGWDGDNALTAGARYNPQDDRWTPISADNAPRARTSHSAVWTGNRMIVWGGAINNMGSSPLSSGGLYDPGTDTWAATAAENAPEGRNQHNAVWTGTEMIIWGGSSGTMRFGGGKFRP